MTIQDLCDFVTANNGMLDFSFGGGAIKFAVSDLVAFQASLAALNMDLQILKLSVSLDKTQTVYVALPIDDLLSSAQTIDDQVAAVSLLVKLIFSNVNTTKPAPDVSKLIMRTAANSKTLSVASAAGSAVAVSTAPAVAPNSS